MSSIFNSVMEWLRVLDFGPAIQCPVMEDSKFVVCRRVDIQFKRVRAEREGGFHRGDRVLEVGMARRQHPAGRACVGAKIRAVEILG